MKFDLVVGNPPYTDPTGKRSIYHKIINGTNQKGHQSWIIPTGWFRMKHLTPFRQQLFANGLFSIKTLPYNYFNGNVLTCIIKVIPHYDGLIQVNNFGNCYQYDYRALGYVILGDSVEAIDQLVYDKPLKPYKFFRGVGDNDKAINCFRHRLTTTYQNGHTEHTANTYNGDPRWYALSRFYYQPNDGSFVDRSHTYCLVNNEVNARETIAYLRGIKVANILRQTRTNRTMGNVQLEFIPRLQS